MGLQTVVGKVDGIVGCMLAEYEIVALCYVEQPATDACKHGNGCFAYVVQRLCSNNQKAGQHDCE